MVIDEESWVELTPEQMSSMSADELEQYAAQMRSRSSGPATGDSPDPFQAADPWHGGQPSPMRQVVQDMPEPAGSATARRPRSASSGSHRAPSGHQDSGIDSATLQQRLDAIRSTPGMAAQLQGHMPGSPSSPRSPQQAASPGGGIWQHMPFYADGMPGAPRPAPATDYPSRSQRVPATAFEDP